MNSSMYLKESESSKKCLSSCTEKKEKNKCAIFVHKFFCLVEPMKHRNAEFIIVRNKRYLPELDQNLRPILWE